MAEQRRLTPGEIESALPRLGGWRLEGGRLRWERKFRDFVDAFGFMTRVALVAEALNHHPDWRNSWATVSIELVTHDAGGVTARDLLLAERISALADEPHSRAPRC